MKCPHCGEELPEGFTYIEPNTEATEEIKEQSGVLQTAEQNNLMQKEEAVPQPYFQQSYSEKQHKTVKRVIAAAVCVVVLIIAVSGGLFAKNIFTTKRMQSKMEGTWYTGGSMLNTVQLTVTEDTLSYSESFGFMQMNSGSGSYKVISGKAIKINGEKHFVSFDSDKGTMTITPGILSSGSEIWYSTQGQDKEDNTEQQPQNGNGATT